MSTMQRPFHAHEEQSEVFVALLIGVKNVGAVLVKQARDACDKAAAIGAVDEEDGG